MRKNPSKLKCLHSSRRPFDRRVVGHKRIDSRGIQVPTHVCMYVWVYVCATRAPFGLGQSFSVRRSPDCSFHGRKRVHSFNCHIVEVASWIFVEFNWIYDTRMPGQGTISDCKLIGLGVSNWRWCTWRVPPQLFGGFKLRRTKSIFNYIFQRKYQLLDTIFMHISGYPQWGGKWLQHPLWIFTRTHFQSFTS